METSRRDVMWAALAGWLLGVEQLAVAGPLAGAEPPPLPEGMLARMAELDRDGVVFVLPEDVVGRQALGEALQRLLRAAELRMEDWHLERPKLPGVVTLHEAVYAVASGGAVGARAGEDVVLVGPDGHRKAGGTVDLSSPRGMIRGLRELLDQEPYASERRARISMAEVERLRAELPSRPVGVEPDPEVLRVAPAFVADLEPIEGPMSAEQQQLVWRLPSELSRALAGERERDGAEPVIFGVRWHYESYDPCPLCGMGSFDTATRVFADFATEE